MWQALDTMKANIQGQSLSDEARDRLMGNLSTGAMTTLSTFVVGIVTWLFRGASMLSSFMTTLPLWRSFDLMPILDTKKKERKAYKEQAKEEQGRDEDLEKIDSLFDAEEPSQTDSHNERTSP